MTASKDFHDRLTRRFRRVGQVVPSELVARLEVYFSLLQTWNRKINLSGLDLSDPSPDVLDRLLVEPVLAARYVEPGTKTVIDIGSGGGSPAIPLALSINGCHLTMVESKTRKSVFLVEAARALGMDHWNVLTARFEELLSKPSMHEASDLLSIRAVRVDARTLSGLQSFVRPGGQVFLFQSSGGGMATGAEPLLTPRGVHTLVESMRSELVILEKRH